MGALGGYWDIGVGIDSIPFGSEEMLGVWRYLLGADDFCGVVFAGYGGGDPNRGWGGAQDRFRPCVRVPLLPLWGDGEMDGDVCECGGICSLWFVLVGVLGVDKTGWRATPDWPYCFVRLWTIAMH